MFRLRELQKEEARLKIKIQEQLLKNAKIVEGKMTMIFNSKCNTKHKFYCFNSKMFKQFKGCQSEKFHYDLNKHEFLKSHFYLILVIYNFGQ